MSENEAGQDTTTSSGDQTAEAATTEETSTLLTSGDADGEGVEQQEGGEQAADGGADNGGDEATIPETYTFDLPEGMEIDQGLADAVSPVFKEAGLSQDQATALTKVWAEHMQSQQQQAVENFATQLETWATELKNDQEVGGEAFNENAGIARSAIDKLGSDELKEFLDTTGAGNHPAVFKFALKVGQLLKEDQPGSGSGAFKGSDKPDYEKMYPNMAS